MIYIFAANANQAHGYARFKGLAPHDYRPIFEDGRHTLRGVCHPEVILAGSWQSRSRQELNTVQALVQALGGTIVEDNSW